MNAETDSLESDLVLAIIHKLTSNLMWNTFE